MRLVLFIISLVGTAAIAADRPNIVWIVSEDNSAKWLRIYGPGGAPMLSSYTHLTLPTNIEV